MLIKTLRDALTVTERLLRETLHGGRVLAFWLLFPALMLLLFGSMYAGGSAQGSAQGLAHGSGRSFETTVPGILIGAALFFSCLSGPVVVLVGERERGTLRRLLFMPLSGTSYFLGVLLHFALVATLQTVVVYGLAYLFGGRFHGPIGLGVLLIALSVIIYCGLGFVLGSLFASRTEDVNGPVSAIGVPLLVLGGTFFSVSLLPPALYTLAQLDPIFHMISALRLVSAQGAGWQEVHHHVLALLGMAAVSLLGGIYSYRRMLDRERRGA